MSWSSVGNWLKENSSSGAALIGSLLTGNIPGAVAAGISMVSSATGAGNPEDALAILQRDPSTLIRLKEIANERDRDIQKHIEAMALIDMQAFQETQETIRNGDNSESKVVKYTRPGMAWTCLFVTIAYIFTANAPDIAIIITLMTAPWAYMGLREVGKSILAFKGSSHNERS